MKKAITFWSLFLYTAYTASAQCSTCTFGGTKFPSTTLTPTSCWQTQPGVNGGTYAEFNVLSGRTYFFSYCSQNGGSSNFDTRLILFNGTTYLTCNSDYGCPPLGAARVDWTATYTGIVRVRTLRFVSSSNQCAASGTGATLAYKEQCPSLSVPNNTSPGSTTAPGPVLTNPVTVQWTSSGTTHHVELFDAITGNAINLPPAADCINGQNYTLPTQPAGQYKWSVHRNQPCGCCEGSPTAEKYFQVSTTCTQPSTQAFIGAYTNNTTGTSITVNWTRGNGTAGVIVVARLNSTANVNPTNGTNYTANAAFGSGATTGSGNYVVYKGTGNNVTVTNLNCATAYNFNVYEYNTTGICYKVPGSSSGVTTAVCPSCTQPSTQASIGAYTNNTTGTSITVNWTRGNGTAGVIVVARLTTDPNVNPSSGTNYTANAAFGSGSTTGPGNYVVYKGNGTNVTVTGLSCATGYSFSVYEYNTTGLCYKTPGSSSGVTTAGCPSCTQPSTQASIGAYTNNISGTSITVNWTRGNGTGGVIVVARLSTDGNVNPINGTNYNANAAFGSGSTTGVGNYVVYKGTGTSANVTGLLCITNYTFTIYEFNNSGLCYKTPGSSSNISTVQCNTNCTFTINPNGNYSVPFLGTTSTINLTTQPYCSWTATPNSSWITITPGNESGTWTLTYTVALNLSPSPRTGTINIAGNIFTIVQASNPVPDNLLSPLGTPDERVNPSNPNSSYKYQLKQSLPYVPGNPSCPTQPTATLWNWSFWERGTCAGGHSATGPLGDRRWSLDCNLRRDLELDCGQPVYPIADGYISTEGSWGGIGSNQVLIRHGGPTPSTTDWYSGYLHMNNIIARIDGQFVTKSTSIGKISRVEHTKGCYAPNSTVYHFELATCNMDPHLDFAVYYKDGSRLKSVHRTFVDRYVPWSKINITPHSSFLTNANIYYKKLNSTWEFFHSTDNYGNAGITSMPPMLPRDSIKIKPNNFEEIAFEIDSDILNHRTYVPMFKEEVLNSKITNPAAISLNNLLYYTTPMLDLKITGKNFNTYDIIKFNDFGDSLSHSPIIVNRPAFDSLVTIALTDTGWTDLIVRYIGVNDTVETSKRFYYNPTIQNNYSVPIIADSKFLGAHIYIDGSYYGDIGSVNTIVSLLPGRHDFSFHFFGYQDTVISIDETSSAINLSMNEIPLIFYRESESHRFDFVTRSKIQYRKMVTLLDKSKRNIISMKQYWDDFTNMGLISKSRKFEFLHLNPPNWSDIKFAAILDQIVVLSRKNIYLLKISGNNKYSKFDLNSNPQLADYDSAVQKLTHDYINFDQGRELVEALVIMEKQAPVMKHLHNIPIHSGEIIKYPISAFVSDPDSIKNDITLVSASPYATINGNWVYIIAPVGFTGTLAFTLTATHDFLEASHDFYMKVMPPDIYVPTGFTPNSDGLNDVLTPQYMGKLLSCLFTIYDRSGQKVFETTDCTRGWDGKINGVAQNTATYVWMLSYQFEGEDKKLQKGTTTLIR